MDKIRYLELCNAIKQYNKEYYVDNASSISDSDYDALYRELLSIEAEHPEWVTADSPTSVVGGNVSQLFEPVTHMAPMYSLKTETDNSVVGADRFIERIKERTGLPSHEFCLEVKYDGLALSLDYEWGILKRAATRGDGLVGENVTQNAIVIESIPKELPWTDIKHLCVRGEVLVPKDTFDSINEKLAAKGEKTFANARNLASGSLRQLDSSVTANRGLVFYAYGVGYEDGWFDMPTRHSDVLLALESIGFTIAPKYMAIVESSDSKLVFSFHKTIERLRESIPFDIDGVVYKLNAVALQRELGVTGKEPNWAVAHKFDPPQVTTRLIAIDVQVGRTGRITPVARVKPVKVGGVTVSNSTLHNRFEVRKKKIRAGQMIRIRRAGDVIPEIVGPALSDVGKYYPNFRMPTHCPDCGAPVIREKGSKDYRCTNAVSCEKQLIGAVEHFVSRRCMDIKGFGEETAASLVALKTVQSLVDIYKLTDESLKTTDLGPKQRANLLTAIDESRTCTLQRFIYALGIRHTGEGTSTRISACINTFEQFLALTYESLMDIDDIGPTTAASIYEYLHNEKSRAMLLELSTFMNFKEGPVITVVDDKLKDKVVVVTGTFEGYSRDQLKDKIVSMGGKFSSGVTSKTDYLLAGVGCSNSKIVIAKKHGTTVIGPEGIDDFFKST